MEKLTSLLSLNFIPRRYRNPFIELLALLVVVFGSIIELRHIANSSWLQLFLYNGDSLTLAVIRESLHHNEPFLWVFSSQFSLFPEGIFYFLSSVITGSIRASFVANAEINLITLYALMRLIASRLGGATRPVQRIFGLSITLLFVLYTILERQAHINQSSLATLYLFTTYYYGVIVSSFLSIYIILIQLSHQSIKLSKFSLKYYAFGALSLSVAGLTTFSNPLYLVQFLIPFILVLLLMFLCNSISLKRMLYIGLPQLIGTGIGYASRGPFKDFIGQSLNSHVSTYGIPNTLSIFNVSVHTLIHSKSGEIELSLWIIVFLFNVMMSLRWLYTKTRQHVKNELSGRIIVSLLGVVGPTFIIVVSIATGSMTTRYLLPIVMLPLPGLLGAISFTWFQRCQKYLVPATVLIGCLIFIGGILSISGTNKLTQPSTYIDNRCLADALDNKPAYGVGQYWVVRALDVYGNRNQQALQIYSNFTLYPWLTNLGDYFGRSYSFVVVNKFSNSSNPGAILPNDPHLPSKPSKISNCADIFIYQYSPGSVGYRQLNQELKKSYEYLVPLRASGEISKYFSLE